MVTYRRCRRQHQVTEGPSLHTYGHTRVLARDPPSKMIMNRKHNGFGHIHMGATDQSNYFLHSFQLTLAVLCQSEPHEPCSFTMNNGEGLLRCVLRNLEACFYHFVRIKAL